MAQIIKKKHVGAKEIIILVLQSLPILISSYIHKTVNSILFSGILYWPRQS